MTMFATAQNTPDVTAIDETSSSSPSAFSLLLSTQASSSGPPYSSEAALIEFKQGIVSDALVHTKRSIQY